MKKRSIVIKPLACLLSCLFAMSVMMPVALADKPNKSYSPSLLTPIINDGVAYLPVDVMEMLLKEQGYQVQFLVQKPVKNVVVTIRQDNSDTNNERQRIWINWSDGSVENVDNVISPEHPYGRIEKIGYDRSTGQAFDVSFGNYLNHQLLNIDGDGTVYMAASEVDRAMQLLLDDPNYTVPIDATN